MRLSFKFVTLTALIGSVCIPNTFAQDNLCPKITKKELETLCNPKIIEKLRLGEAGKVTTEDGKTLMNLTESCTGWDSLRSFLSHDKDKIYEGKLSKHPRDPNSKVLKLCTYEIHTFNKDTHIPFGVLFPKPIEISGPIMEEKKPKKLYGVNIYGGGSKESEFQLKPQKPERPKAPLPEEDMGRLSGKQRAEPLRLPEPTYQPSNNPPRRLLPSVPTDRRPLPQPQLMQDND